MADLPEQAGCHLGLVLAVSSSSTSVTPLPANIAVLQVANHDDFWKQISFRGKKVLPVNVSVCYLGTQHGS